MIIMNVVLVSIPSLTSIFISWVNLWVEMIGMEKYLLYTYLFKIKNSKLDYLEQIMGEG